jgi:hypothetical protein
MLRDGIYARRDDCRHNNTHTYRSAPLDAGARLEPLGVLVDHRVDDVHKRLVAREEAVSACQQVPFEPTLALCVMGVSALQFAACVR